MEKNQIYIKLSIAPPHKIEEWANNRIVYRPDSFSFISHLPERDGIFCEKTFGPLRKNQCRCGKYKNLPFSGFVCEKCGVEISDKNLRREKMGYIRLFEPIIHPWFIQDDEYSYISNLIDLSNSDIKNLQDKKSYIILSQGYTNLVQKNQIFNETEIRLILKKLLEDIRATIDSNNEVFSLCNEYIKQLNYSYYSSYERPNYNKFFDITRKYLGIEFGTGVNCILEKLSEIDIQTEINKTKELLNSDNQNVKLHKKLETLLLFKKSNTKPEWMVLENIAVMPADFRHHYRGNANHVKAINDLYKKIIETNNRCNKYYLEQEVSKLRNLINRLFNEKSLLSINALPSFLKDINILYTNETIDIEQIKSSLFKNKSFVFNKPSRSLLDLIKILNSFGIDVTLYNENNKKMIFDENGFNSEGVNLFGLKKHAKLDEYDCNGYNILGFDKDGFDESGFDSDGFNIHGINKNGTKYDNFGFDIDGKYGGESEYNPRKIDVLGKSLLTPERKLLIEIFGEAMYEHNTHTKEEFEMVYSKNGDLTSIEYLNLSHRTYKTLLANDINNIAKLKSLKIDIFIRGCYLGASSVYKMKNDLKEYNIYIDNNNNKKKIF